MASDETQSKADAILARLNVILHNEVDMAITTQRQITNKLAEQFGEEAYEYKALIKVVPSLALSIPLRNVDPDTTCRMQRNAPSRHAPRKCNKGPFSLICRRGSASSWMKLMKSQQMILT